MGLSGFYLMPPACNLKKCGFSMKFCSKFYVRSKGRRCQRGDFFIILQFKGNMNSSTGQGGFLAKCKKC